MSWEIRQGDALEEMRAMPAASVDAIVTDPPYGLAFMGREWDQRVSGSLFWSEALRVGKPGIYMLAFGGTRKFHRLACAIEDAGWLLQDCLMWLHGQGFPKGGMQLKPAWEPILLSYKPGQRALNVDGCRIGSTKNVPASVSQVKTSGIYGSFDKGGISDGPGHDPNVGRWPANVVLDEEAARLLDEQSGDRTSGIFTRRKTRYRGDDGSRFVGVSDDHALTGHTGGDTGGASRFFYTAKADSGERHYAGRNTHPTVKPVDLMRWLCRMVTPRGGLVLDPFMGSGSTGVAALAEGFRFIGIDREAEYVEIARKRIAGPLFAESPA